MGQETCGMCYGKKTNLKRSDCNVCGGSGMVACECGASAMSPGDITNTCFKCGNTGKRECTASGCVDGIVPVEVECERCGGKGYVET